MHAFRADHCLAQSWQNNCGELGRLARQYWPVYCIALPLMEVLLKDVQLSIGFIGHDALTCSSMLCSCAESLNRSCRYDHTCWLLGRRRNDKYITSDTYSITAFYLFFFAERYLLLLPLATLGHYMAYILYVLKPQTTEGKKTYCEIP